MIFYGNFSGGRATLQQKLKEEREARRASLDARHQYLCGVLAMKLGVEDSEVEEYLLDEGQVCETYIYL